jgi:hypothetical protein
MSVVIKKCEIVLQRQRWQTQSILDKAANLGEMHSDGVDGPTTASMCQNVVVRDHEQGSRP